MPQAGELLAVVIAHVGDVKRDVIPALLTVGFGVGSHGDAARTAHADAGGGRGLPPTPAGGTLSPPARVAPGGMRTGIQPSASRAVWATLLGVSEAMKIGMSGAQRLETQSEAALQREHLALVMQRLLGEDYADNLNVLAQARQGRLEGHPVPVLDDAVARWFRGRSTCAHRSARRGWRNAAPRPPGCASRC